APFAHARRQPEVEEAGIEVGAAEGARHAVPIAQAQQHHHRKMGADRLAADGQRRHAELRLAGAGEPEGGGLAILERGGGGMLRRQPVLDREANETAAVGDALQQHRRDALGRIALGLVEQVGEDQREIDERALGIQAARCAQCRVGMAPEDCLEVADMQLVALARGDGVAAPGDGDVDVRHQSCSAPASRAIN
ncbi:hypothetical protein QU38_02550, partial [Staphylococcus aureus]